MTRCGRCGATVADVLHATQVTRRKWTPDGWRVTVRSLCEECDLADAASWYGVERVTMKATSAHEVKRTAGVSQGRSHHWPQNRG